MIHQIDTFFIFCRHDKLIIDDHVYIFNEQEHRIERLPSSLSPGSLDVGKKRY